MSEWEKTVDQEIKKWYRSIDDEYFDYKPWHHLYDEERRMLSEMYWEDMLNQDNQREIKSNG